MLKIGDAKSRSTAPERIASNHDANPGIVIKDPPRATRQRPFIRIQRRKRTYSTVGRGQTERAPLQPAMSLSSKSACSGFRDAPPLFRSTSPLFLGENGASPQPVAKSICARDISGKKAYDSVALIKPIRSPERSKSSHDGELDLTSSVVKGRAAESLMRLGFDV